MSKTLRFLQVTAEHQDCPFFTVFLTIKTLSQNIAITLLQIPLKFHEKSLSERFWKNRSQCREMLLQVKQVMASFCSYGNFDVITTLIITNFHLYLIQPKASYLTTQLARLNLTRCLTRGLSQPVFEQHNKPTI